MNFKLVILAVFVSIISCTTNIGDRDPFENIHIEFEIVNDYLKNEERATLIISNAFGDLVETQEIENGQKIIFDIAKEDDPIYLSFFRFEDYSDPYVTIQTYLISDDIKIRISEKQDWNISEKLACVNFNNFHIDEQFTGSSSYLASFGNGSTKCLFPRYYPYNMVLLFDFEDFGIKKMYSMDFPNSDFSDTISFEDLVDPMDSVLVDYPADGYLESSLYGKRIGKDPTFQLISSNYDSYTRNEAHYLPPVNYDELVLHSNIFVDDTVFTSYKIFSNLDLSYQKPKLDFEVLDTLKSNIHIKSYGVSEANYFKIFFGDWYSPDYLIRWSVYGEFDEEIQIALPDLERYLGERIYTYNPSGLEYFYSSLFSFSMGYSDFIKFRLEGVRTSDFQGKLECKEIWKEY